MTAGTNAIPRGATGASGAPSSTVETRLRRRIEAFEDAALRTRDGEDRSAIHDLRVASRRLVAFLSLWRELLPHEDFRQIVRELRALRRQVGRVRDLEVQVELLRERLARQGADDQEAMALLRDLDDRLGRRRRRAAKRVRPKRGNRLLALLDRAEQGTSQDLVSRLRAFEAAHAREGERREAAIEGVRASLESGDDAALHQARIAIKKWRYAVESLGENQAPGAGITLDRLRELQEVLGEMLDRSALRTAISQYADGRLTPALQSVMDELESERRGKWERFRVLCLALPGTLQPAPA